MGCLQFFSFVGKLIFVNNCKMRIGRIFILLVAGIVFLSPLFLPDLFYGQKRTLSTETKNAPVQSLPVVDVSEVEGSSDVDDKQALLNYLSDLIANQDAQFGIEISDLVSGERLGLNQNQKFHAASTSKVLVAAYALKKVDEKKLELDQILDGIPLQERLRLMINISDNQSWEFLLATLGFAQIQNFGKKIGLLDSDVYQNTTTAHDLTTLLTKLYNQEILSPQSTELLFSWMQNTEREDLIPQAVPQNIPVYHKTGSFEGETHDTAIVVHPRQPFVLSILSDGSQERSELIRRIVRAIYQFVDQKKG